MDVRIGILGVGGFGRYCLEQYRQLPGVRITAIGGTNPAKYARLAATYDVPFHTTDWRELAAHPEIDILYLATPPDLRAEPALHAMAAGKHVFCEKPLALSLADADAMLAAAEQHGVRLGINFVMRYAPLYAIARALAAEQLLGEPQYFSFENLAGDLPPGHWFWDARRSGGIPVEHGVHFFDIFTVLFGEGQLQWAGFTARPTGEEDRWLVTLRYGPRVFGTFYHAFGKPASMEHTRALLDFTQGAVTLEGWIPARLRLDGLADARAAARIAELIPSANAAPLPDSETFQRGNGTLARVEFRVQADFAPVDRDEVYARAVREAMADFIAWTRDGSHHPRVTGADGRSALRTALDAVALARHAGKHAAE